MSTSRIPSPARSQGAKATPRRYKKRGPRSVGSPAQPNSSVKLSAMIQMDSFTLSPLPNRRSVLTDTTDIEVPGRKSWWKKLDENSQEVMEVFSTNEPADNINAIEECIDIDILSQENQKKNYTLDLPESSDGESISSIVIPQRKLFTQKENHAQNKFSQIIDNRENLAKLHKSQAVDERALNVAPKNLFNQATKPRSKPVFPAGLLNISANKTLANKTKEIVANEAKGQVKNLFGNRAGTKRKNMFTDFIASDSEDDISEIQPKLFAFQKKQDLKRVSNSRGQREASPTSSVTDIEIDDWRHLPSSTMVEHQLEDGVTTTPIKRARLSKLTEVGESVNTENTVNKSKLPNKSLNSKNKSKNKSQKYAEAIDKEILDDNAQLQSSEKVINDSDPHATEVVENEEDMLVDHNIGVETEKESEQNDRHKLPTTAEEKLKEKSMRSSQTDKNKSRQNIDNLDKATSDQREISDKIQAVNDVLNTGEHEEREEIQNEIDNPSNDSKIEPINRSTRNVDKIDPKNKSLGKSHKNVNETFEAQDNNKNKKKDHTVIHNDSNAIQTRDQNNSEEINMDQRSRHVELNQEVEDHEDNEDIQEEQEESEAIENDQEEDNNQNESEILESQGESQKSSESESEEVEEDDEDNGEDEEDGDQEDEELAESPVLEMENEDEEHKSIESKNLSNISKNKSQNNVSDVKNQKHNLGKDEDYQDQEDNSVQNYNQNVESEGVEVLPSQESDDENDNDKVEDDMGSQEVEECEAVQEEMVEEEIGNQEDEGHDVNEDVELKYEEDESGDKVDNNDGNIDESEEIDNDNQKELQQNVSSNRAPNTSVNISHDTTGRHRKKNERKITSPEAILHDKTNDMESFIGQGRNTSVRKTKSIIKNLNIRPSLAPVRESTGMDGTQNSSAEGSGWDSHRVTRKTLRHTFGKDFTPRKSLRTLVMEKSAKRHTNFTDMNAEISRLPQANSTEFPEPEAFDMDEVDDAQEIHGSDQELSKRVGQTSEVDDAEEMQESEKDLSNKTRHSSKIDPQDVTQRADLELSNKTRQSAEIENDNDVEESDHEQLNNSTEVEYENEIDESDHEQTNRTRQSTAGEDADGSEESEDEQSNRTHESNAVEDTNESEESDHEMTNTKHSTAVEDASDSDQSEQEMSNRTSHSIEVDEDNEVQEADQEWSKQTNQISEIDEAPYMEQSAHEHSNRTRQSAGVEDVDEIEESDEVSIRTRHSTALDDPQDIQVSDHELSKRTRQTTLEMYLEKIKKQNIEKKRKMEEQIRNSLKAPHRDMLNPFKVPAKPLRRTVQKKVQNSKPKAKPLLSSIIPLDMLPEELLQDMKYKPPKRYQPANASWITKRLYKFLETKLEAKYDYKARVRAEKLVETIYNFTKDIRRHGTASTDAVEVLKHEMARLEIVKTHFEFYEFFHEYMPREIRVKVVPDVVNKISLPKHGVFADILR